MESARTLFLKQGYEATGLSEIARAADVNAGSLYYFFRTKEELLLAVLDRYRALLDVVIAGPAFAAEADPILRVFEVLAGYRKFLEDSGCRFGCPIGNLALEMGEKSEAVREGVASNFRNWRRMIEECLKQGADRFPQGTDFEKLSTFILTVMEGAVMQARTFRSLEPFDASVELLRDYVERVMAGGGRRRSGGNVG